MLFNTFARLYDHYHQFLDIFITPEKKPHTLEQSFPFPHSPQPLMIPNLLSVFMDLPFLDISYKWENTMYGLLCLPSLI